MRLLRSQQVGGVAHSFIRLEITWSQLLRLGRCCGNSRIGMTASLAALTAQRRASPRPGSSPQSKRRQSATEFRLRLARKKGGSISDEAIAAERRRAARLNYAGSSPWPLEHVVRGPSSPNRMNSTICTVRLDPSRLTNSLFRNRLLVPVRRILSGADGRRCKFQGSHRRTVLMRSWWLAITVERTLDGDRSHQPNWNRGSRSRRA